jgi:hypothetical protein
LLGARLHNALKINYLKALLLNISY